MSCACAGGIVSMLELDNNGTTAGDDDIACRNMEEGAAYGGDLPLPPIDISNDTWNLMNIAFRWFTTIVGTGMLACLFVARFVYNDPQVQDPSEMLLFTALALGAIGTGYLPTLLR